MKGGWVRHRANVLILRTFVILAALIGTCQAAMAQQTALYFSSSSGDYIGAGQQRFYESPQVNFAVHSNSSSSAVGFSVTNFAASPSIWWYLDFAAPNNAPLVPGTYLNAVRYPFQSSSQAGLSLYGDGRGCNTLTGEFTVREAVYSAGTVVSFAADFIQHCEGGSASAHGGIRYNSSVTNPVPGLSSLSPTSVPSGSAFTLTVNGANFIPGSYVQWNGGGRPTQFVSSAQLNAAIPAGDLTASGSAVVTVFNPGQGGGTSNSLGVSITNPLPKLTSITPTTVVTGGQDFTLTVSGSSFVSGAVVQWNGADRNTTFVSATQLTAAIPAADIAAIGTVQITVVNPQPGGGSSNAVSLSIVNPVPRVTSLAPATAVAGSDTFSLIVNGSNFLPGSLIQWNRNSRTTTFVSSTQLTATIPAGDVAVVGNVQISVLNPPPGGGSSNSLLFSIVNPAPVISSLAPSSANAGGPAFALTITGSNFIPGSVVRWNGSARPTLVTATQLTAAIPATDIVNVGTVQVTVFNPAPGGGLSNALAFNVLPTSGDSFAYVYYFPQLAVGGGWQTTLTYLNYSPQTVQCQTSFLTDSGEPFSIAFGGAPSSGRNDTLPPGGSVHQESSADPGLPITSGWAKMQCTGAVKASILYRSYQEGVAISEASVSAVQFPATKFVTFANDRTGVAYANPSAQPAVITFNALSSAGTNLGTASLTLPPGMHGAAFVGQLAGVKNFTGSVQIVSTVPIVSLSLNFEAAPVFSSLPPGDLDNSTPLAGQR